MSSAIATSPTMPRIDAVFAEVARLWGGLDFLVHAIAFSDKDQLTGRYIDTTADNFTKTLLISCYSLTAVAQRAEKLMTEWRLDPDAHLLRRREGDAALQRHGDRQGGARGERALSRRRSRRQGIRVNAISSGPIKTLAAAGIGDFRYILKWNELNSPLKRSVDLDEVGDAALFLLSDLGRSVTGEIVHTDAGYHVVGMKAVDAPDIATVKD